MAVNVAYEPIAGRQKALNVYRQMSIETATPAELVLMLYNQALRSMREALDALDEKDIQETNRHLQRAQEIVSELRVSLNIPAGGKMTQDLDTMYEYVNRRLLEANIRKDPALVADAAKVMGAIRDGWAEAVKSYGSGH